MLGTYRIRRDGYVVQGSKSSPVTSVRLLISGA